MTKPRQILRFGHFMHTTYKTIFIAECSKFLFSNIQPLIGPKVILVEGSGYLHFLALVLLQYFEQDSAYKSRITHCVRNGHWGFIFNWAYFKYCENKLAAGYRHSERWVDSQYNCIYEIYVICQPLICLQQLCRQKHTRFIPCCLIH